MQERAKLRALPDVHMASALVYMEHTAVEDMMRTLLTQHDVSGLLQLTTSIRCRETADNPFGLALALAVEYNSEEAILALLQHSASDPSRTCTVASHYWPALDRALDMDPVNVQLFSALFEAALQHDPPAQLLQWFSAAIDVWDPSSSALSYAARRIDEEGLQENMPSTM